MRISTLSLYNPKPSERIYEKLAHECGPVILRALEDPDVTEIMLNPNGFVWVESKSTGMVNTGYKMDPVQAFNLIGTVADLHGDIINENKPILEAEMPLDGSRFEAAIPNVVIAPSFTLRKRARRIFTLDDYIHQSILSISQADSIRKAIHERASILVVGGPGTGKTTLTNAILNEMVHLGDSNQRFVIIEDTRELQCAAQNTLSLKVTPAACHQSLLRMALRSRPDKICMGECRGAEVLTLLKAWNTGTPGGIATIHANTARSALIRIGDMIEEAGVSRQHNLICEAINIVISLSFDLTHGRKVDEILRVKGFKNDEFVFEVFN